MINLYAQWTAALSPRDLPPWEASGRQRSTSSCCLTLNRHDEATESRRAEHAVIWLRAVCVRADVSTTFAKDTRCLQPHTAGQATRQPGSPRQPGSQAAKQGSFAESPLPSPR